MAREKILRLIDMDNVAVKRELMRSIGTLHGMYQVSLAPRRATRTQQQNAYLWGVVYQSMVDFMADQGDNYTAEDVHEFFKLKFLRRTVVNTSSGEVLGSTVTSTTALDINEFCIYVDQIIAWLAERLSVVVPGPDEYLAKHQKERIR